MQPIKSEKHSNQQGAVHCLNQRTCLQARRRAYHQRNARLRLLSPPANLSLGCRAAPVQGAGE